MDLPNDLQRAVFRLNRSLRSVVYQAGFSAADAMLLAIIRKAPGIGVSELAAKEGVGRSVVSERVTRLQAKGLIQRAAPTRGGDLRRVGLSLTPAGRKIFAEVAARRREAIEDRLSVLTSEQCAVLKQAAPLLDLLADFERATENQNSRETNDE